MFWAWSQISEQNMHGERGFFKKKNSIWNYWEFEFYAVKLNCMKINFVYQSKKFKKHYKQA